MATLVLVPGLLSDARIWAPLRRQCEGQMAVVDADLTAGTSVAGMAHGLLAETEGPLLVAGHSMGGRIAMDMARQAPDRIMGLVLANTGHHPLRDGETEKREAMIALGHRNMAELVAAWLPPMLDPDRIVDQALMSDLTTMAMEKGPDVHERQIRALIDRPDAGAALSTIQCPVLLIAARQDDWSPIGQHREIAALTHDAELAIIDHAGHFAPAERPDEVTAAIIDWMRRRFGDLA